MKFYKRSWISVGVLKAPEFCVENINKGVIVLNQVDPLLELFPSILHQFIVVERHAWFGVNEATRANIMLVEDMTAMEELKSSRKDSLLLGIGPADFVDHSSFIPLGIKPDFDVIQISCWSPRKRIELLIEAAAKLPDLKFVHLGHFENEGSNEELEYRKYCVELASKIAKNIQFPFGCEDNNETLPNTKKEINHWINRAKIGVLTAQSEGINRFKMECLSANIPFLVASDVAWPTKKHINSTTGMVFSPNADSLANTISYAIRSKEKFTPRCYILNTTGIDRSLRRLRNALKEYCFKHEVIYRFDDILWDGRNDSLIWGEGAVVKLESIESNYHQYCGSIKGPIYA